MSERNIDARGETDSAAVRADACAMVIFGGGGDLTKRLVTPALYNLVCSGLLPENFAIIGVDRAQETDETWRENLTAMMESFVGGTGEFDPPAIDQARWDWLRSRMFYLKGDFGDPATFEAIKVRLAALRDSHGTAGNALFYLAVADRFFAPIIEGLGAAGLADASTTSPGDAWRRVIVEKPFGHDLASAKALNARILKVLREDQVYRIDHFLGKETVQNIMAFRFANGLFEPVWSRDHIDHVQITVAETVGVEGRGGFYESAGALRDMVPNHLFQLVAMTAMEPPATFDADDIRTKKVDVFKSMRTVEPSQAVRGQYDAGTVLGGSTRPYRSEPNVNPRSGTETYVAMELAIDNWRWTGVPFYLRTGKHMTSRTTEIAIRLKPAPTAMFARTKGANIQANWIVIQIQPEEGIALDIEAKRPGPVVKLAGVKMGFAYKDWFPAQQNVGYETLLYDAMIGDQTLFQRADQVEEAWRVVDDVLHAWAETPATDFPNYVGGGAGPEEADALLARGEGRVWRPVRVGPARPVGGGE